MIRARASGEFVTSYRSDTVLHSVVGCKLAAQTLILLSIRVDWSPVLRRTCGTNDSLDFSNWDKQMENSP